MDSPSLEIKQGGYGDESNVRATFKAVPRPTWKRRKGVDEIPELESFVGGGRLVKWNGRRVRLVVLSGALYTTAALGVYHTWINPDQPGPVKAQSNQQPKKVVEYVS